MSCSDLYGHRCRPYDSIKKSIRNKYIDNIVLDDAAFYETHVIFQESQYIYKNMNFLEEVIPFKNDPDIYSGNLVEPSTERINYKIIIAESNKGNNKITPC